ncbi:MAG: cell division protein FtsX [Mangrovibacterium sp.]
MKKNNTTKGRSFRSYISTTISISLVLFLIGLLSLLLLNANRLSDYVQEHIGFTLELHDNASDSDVLRLQKRLSSSDFVRESIYVTKDQAAEKLAQELGENFVDFLGFNPLYSSLELKLHAEFMNAEQLLLIEKQLLEYSEVKNVYYHRDLVQIINNNVHKAGLFLLSFSGLLLFIFTALINNTVRISMHNQRFNINTMKLVGATHAFIRKPFIKQSVITGIIGSLIAIAFILLSLLSYQNSLDIAFQINSSQSTIITFVIILILGIVISSASTYFSVNKYLRMKYEELF